MKQNNIASAPSALGPVVLIAAVLYIVCWVAGVLDPLTDDIRSESIVHVCGWLAFLYLPYGVLESLACVLYRPRRCV